MSWLRVHSSRTLAEAELVISHLQNEGIGSELRGEAGVRLGVAQYEVWVEARNEARAIEAVRTLTDAADATLTCPRCSESNPGNFELCWKCGTIFPLA